MKGQKKLVGKDEAKEKGKKEKEKKKKKRS